jgi:hypothetical protein
VDSDKLQDSNFELFKEKKDAIYDLINNSPYLSVRKKKEMISYLDSFYDALNNSSKTEKEFSVNCN